MTLWKVADGGVRLTDELFTAYTPCGVRPRDRDTGGAANSANGLISFTLCRDKWCLFRLRSDESAMPAVFGRAAVQPGATFVHVVFFLDQALVRRYERGYESKVHVAAPRVVSVVPDSGQLRQTDPVARNTAIRAASRRSANARPAQARSSRGRSLRRRPGRACRGRRAASARPWGRRPLPRRPAT
jgi:hypothetical protein